jgi:membrane-associated phospholipid phosphatase
MRRSRGRAALVIVGLAIAPLTSPAPASPQSLDPSERSFWLLSGAALLAALHLDTGLRRADPTDATGLRADLASTGYRLGGRSFVASALISTTAASQLTGWPAEGSRMIRVAVGITTAGVATEVIKNTVGRGRPRDVDDPGRFRPFVRENAWLSFPSGHATAGFAIAGALDEEFDLRGFEVLAYGMAGLIAWSRVHDDAHWTSDTVAGAIVGVAASRATVSWLRSRSGDAGPTLTLGVVEGAPMLSVTIPVPRGP